MVPGSRLSGLRRRRTQMVRMRQLSQTHAELRMPCDCCVTVEENRNTLRGHQVMLHRR